MSLLADILKIKREYGVRSHTKAIRIYLEKKLGRRPTKEEVGTWETILSEARNPEKNILMNLVPPDGHPISREQVIAELSEIFNKKPDNLE